MADEKSHAAVFWRVGASDRFWASQGMLLVLDTGGERKFWDFYVQRKRQRRGKERKDGICTEDTKKKRQEGHGMPCPYGRMEMHEGESLRAEEDGFALEGFDGDEDGDGRVDAGGGEDRRDGTPMVGAGDDFFADEAGVEDGD